MTPPRSVTLAFTGASGFHAHPPSVAELVGFVVARVLDPLQLPHDFIPRRRTARGNSIGSGVESA